MYYAASVAHTIWGTYQYLRRTGHSNPDKLLAITVKHCGGIVLIWLENNMSLSFEGEPDIRYELFSADANTSPTIAGFVTREGGRYTPYTVPQESLEPTPVGTAYDTLEDAMSVLELLIMIK